LAAHREYSQIHKYRYIVINDDAETAVKELDAIITAEKCRREMRMDDILKG
jgi:guanylate kinase